MESRILQKIVLFFLFAVTGFFIGCSSSTEIGQKESKQYFWFNPDTVKAGRFDFGKMWTFEDAPLDYFQKTYNFRPTQQWLDQVRMSSLRFATWCSAFFVSEDGLIMTNHHCIDFILNLFEEEGEDIPRNGFYAETLEDERRVPNLFVEQMILIKDVTNEIISVIDAGTTEAEKLENKNNIIEKLQNEYSEETGLRCSVISLYSGGKYSLYGYRRYDDVRAVYVNEREAAMYGGDPDNFTYPRYDADFSFFRIYDENGLPLKTDNFFKLSKEGPRFNEPLFVIGNPGSTQKLNTLAQLEYYRDISVRNLDFQFKGLVDIYYELASEYPDKANEYHGALSVPANSGKVFKYRIEALRDPYIMARKKALEEDFKAAVFARPELKQKYGNIWDGIAKLRTELRKIGYELTAYSLNTLFTSQYFTVALTLADIAVQLQLPEKERSDEYKGEKLDSLINDLFSEDIDFPLEKKKLALNIDYITLNLGSDNWLVKKISNGKKGKEAADNILANSVCVSKEKVIDLIKEGPSAILNSSDPLIYYVVNTREKWLKLVQQSQEILNTEQVLSDQLGQALYAVYGTSIPPDATFTLRISDGELQGYEYNGTIAPAFTTFYGMYDRFYSHQKEYPWYLPKRWVNFGPEFDLSTPFNFSSTHDIVGGSSGSAVVNKNKEVVGIAFDGNVESMPGNYIYIPDKNRMISVSSNAILEIVRDLFHCSRLANELELGKIVP